MLLVVFYCSMVHLFILFQPSIVYCIIRAGELRVRCVAINLRYMQSFPGLNVKGRGKTPLVILHKGTGKVGPSWAGSIARRSRRSEKIYKPSISTVSPEQALNRAAQVLQKYAPLAFKEMHKAWISGLQLDGLICSSTWNAWSLVLLTSGIGR